MAGLDKDRFEVEFSCRPHGDLIEEARKNNIVFRPVKHFVQAVSPYNDVMALFELVTLLRKNKYDIVHTHNSKAGFIGRLAAKLAGIPVVVHTIHGFAFHEFEKPWRRKFFIALEKFAAKLCDKLIVISNPLREWGLRLGIGVPWQYITIYSGIDIEKFQPSAAGVDGKKSELNIASGDKIIGMTAKLWPGKGHQYVLRAVKAVAAAVPNVKFVFVGEGNLRQELTALAGQLDVASYVVFTGFRNDIAEITNIFDVAILPSLFEGMGRSILEAMSLAKPVVATRVGGIPDLVDDGVTGILIEPADSEALAGALIALLKDDALRLAMGKAAKNKIDAKFSAAVMVNAIQDVYEGLIKTKRLNELQEPE
jgi:glycosyltransferase involved in cell wall biosynthesis